jgi:hypothetical protein
MEGQEEGMPCPDILSFNPYFVTARDHITGSFDFSIMELEQNPANLKRCNDDMTDLAYQYRTITFEDFGMFASQWLAEDWPVGVFKIVCPSCP